MYSICGWGAINAEEVVRTNLTPMPPCCVQPALKDDDDNLRAHIRQRLAERASQQPPLLLSLPIKKKSTTAYHQRRKQHKTEFPSSLDFTIVQTKVAEALEKIRTEPSLGTRA